ncbi:MAG: TIGR01906 family membrane protein [Clostridia bacterium]|nr:TIGR01906 family membrane protein [Clostridia bacterium]
MKNKASSLYSDILTGIIFMIAAISLSVMITLNFKPLFYHDIKALNICESSGLSEEQIRKNYDILIDYNNFWGAEKLEFDGLAMSNEGRIHFEEVKNIFTKLEYMAVIFSLMFIITALLKIKGRNYRFLLFSGISSVVIPAFVGAVLSINWEWTFVTFHKLAFDNDYWIFYPDKDPVITMLPDAFFMHCAIMIVSITVILSLVSTIMYFILRRKKHVC